MARTDSGGQDSIASYMDGVQVKIAEAYKPPRKIALPAFYNNKLPDVSKYDYDFGFETAVLEKISEWRKVRSSISKTRQDLEDEKQKREEAAKKENPNPEPASAAPDLDNRLAVKVAPPPETTILTPQPLSPLASQIEDIKVNGLDYSDFDNDTSSPFDNMELKTINDMEELAQVLQPVSQWTAPAEPDQTYNNNALNPTQSEEPETEDVEEVSDKEKHIRRDQENNQHLVTSIVQDLQKLLKRPYFETTEPWLDRVPEPKKEPTDSSSADPISNLTEEEQKLAKHLNDMGFPLSRAARAIQALGGQDNKKIVEYLLALQYLEDAGFEEESAAKALVLAKYDEHKAKVYCENLVMLKNFGFSEERASVALLKSDMDRDKALDLLIT